MSRECVQIRGGKMKKDEIVLLLIVLAYVIIIGMFVVEQSQIAVEKCIEKYGTCDALNYVYSV